MELPTQVTIAQVDYRELNEEAEGSLQVSSSFIVDSPVTYELAGEELIAVKSKIKALETRREGITKPLTAAHKSVMDLFRQPLALLGQAKDNLQRGMIAYSTEQERVRREEQARLDAERRRQEAEAAEKVREAERLASAAVTEAQREAAEKARLEAEAAQTVAENATSVAVTATPKADGNSVRKVWKGKCDDKATLIKFVASNPAYASLLEVSQSALDSFAKAQNESFDIPGCVAYQESSIVSRTK